MMRAILWVSVSSEAQAASDRASLEEQERALAQTAREFNWDVIDTIRVPGFSRSFWTYAEFCAAAEGIEITDPARMWNYWRRRSFDILAAVTFSRFAREQSIMAEVIGRTIDAGARVYAVQGGWIDANNRRPMAAMAGLSSATEVDELRRRHKFGMIGRVKRGLPTRTGLTHVIVRDERGRPVAAEVNEANRRLFDDLFDLVVHERIPYNQLEAAMAERGHCDVDGRPYKHGRFWRLLHAPLTYGHTHYGAGRAGWPAGGPWAYGVGEPPEGATINWNAAPPVYTGEQAERLLAELRRRPLMRGSARPRETRAFTAVFRCAVCGRVMTVTHPRRSDSSIRCKGKHKIPAYCTAINAIHSRDARAFFDVIVDRFVASNGELLTAPAPAPDRGRELAQIAAEIDALLVELDGLITVQGRAHPSTRDRYQARIDALGQRLEPLQARRGQIAASVEATAAQHERRISAARALAAVRENIWERPEAEINQLLLWMLGDLRVYVTPGNPRWEIRRPL